MNALLEHILGRVQLIVLLVLSGQNQEERVLHVKVVRKELILAQVLLFVIPVPREDILPKVHQHATFVQWEQSLIVKNLVVKNAPQEHFHQKAHQYARLVHQVPILTKDHLNVFHALKDLNQIKTDRVFVKNAQLELIPTQAQQNVLIAQKEHSQEKALPIA